MSELLLHPGERVARQHRADASDDKPGSLPVVRARCRVRSIVAEQGG